MQDRIVGKGRKVWLVGLVGAALVLAAVGPLGAQSAGNDYLFGEPIGRLTLRAGYAHASAGSDIFDQATKKFTLSKSDFSGPTFGGELAFRLAPRFDLTFDVAYAGVNRRSEYRDFVDNNNLPIRQTTSFTRVPLTANVRAYLTPRGRSVGSLAFIPSTVVPWVGVGGGAMWYRFRQSGDFIDGSGNVIPGQSESSGWGPALQGMGGVDVSVTPRIAVTGDARYTWARASLGTDFSGFNKIDLSGVSVALGLTFRL